MIHHNTLLDKNELQIKYFKKCYETLKTTKLEITFFFVLDFD
jgi:hypothetical protein